MKAKQSDAQVHQPKQLLDLPNEIIDRICEYIAPPVDKPRPVKATDIRRTGPDQWVRPKACLRGRIEYGLEVTTEIDFRDAREDAGSVYGWNFGLHPHGAYFGTLQPTIRLNATRCCDLATFAATCRHLAGRAASVVNRRIFQMTVSNYGITFEGSRSAAPLQTFQTSWGYAMIHSEAAAIVAIPDGTLPGNRAFEIFSNMIPKIRHLTIHVKVDMDWRRARKLKMFLHQISTVLQSFSAEGVLLPSIEVILDADFHYFRTQAREAMHESFLTFHTGPRPVPEGVLRVMLQLEPREQTIINTVVPKLAPILRPMFLALSTILSKQTELRAQNSYLNSGACQTFALSVWIQGDREIAAGSRWGKTVNMHLYVLASRVWERVAASHGSFRDFCGLLQNSVYDTSNATQNHFSEDGFTCKLGLPLPKSTDLTGSETGNGEDCHGKDDEDPDGQAGRPAKRQRVI